MQSQGGWHGDGAGSGQAGYQTQTWTCCCEQLGGIQEQHFCADDGNTASGAEVCWSSQKTCMFRFYFHLFSADNECTLIIYWDFNLQYFGVVFFKEHNWIQLTDKYLKEDCNKWTRMCIEFVSLMLTHYGNPLRLAKRFSTTVMHFI